MATAPPSHESDLLDEAAALALVKEVVACAIASVVQQPRRDHTGSGDGDEEPPPAASPDRQPAESTPGALQGESRDEGGGDDRLVRTTNPLPSAAVPALDALGCSGSYLYRGCRL